MPGLRCSCRRPSACNFCGSQLVETFAAEDERSCERRLVSIQHALAIIAFLGRLSCVAGIRNCMLHKLPTGGVRPRKELYTNGVPSPILVLDDNGLAVVTSSNTVDIFDEKARARVLSANRALNSGGTRAGLAGSCLLWQAAFESSPSGHAGDQHCKLAWARPKLTAWTEDLCKP